MKLLGQVLLWAGFLSGSLAIVFHLPPKGVKALQGMSEQEATEQRMKLPSAEDLQVGEDGWHLIPWTWYSLSVAACGLGVALMTASRVGAGGKSDASEANLKDISRALADLIEDVEKLEPQLEQLAPSEITSYIDEVLTDNLIVFADGRDSITAEHGLAVFAEVMTQFAAGERAINRAWSSAADGYLDETIACVSRAKTCLHEAQIELKSAKG